MDEIMTEPMVEVVGSRSAKKDFSFIGLSLFVYIIVATVAQVLVALLVKVVWPAYDYPEWMFWIANFVPMYCVALPIYYLMIKRIPVEDFVETKTISFPGWLKYLSITIFVMLCGSMIALLFNGLFSLVGINTATTVETLTSHSGILATIVLAIVGPIVEEFMFRKLLIDRMHVYGGKVAVFTSAIMFGLFHGNFAQFFYAFFMGLVWGYVYYKTGKLRYSIFMHITINFCGGVVAPFLMRGLNSVDYVNNPMSIYSNSAAVASIVGLLIYELIMFGVAITGLVFFVLGFKKIAYSQERLELPVEERKKTVWLNVGMILFLVGCVALFVMSLINGYAA